MTKLRIIKGTTQARFSESLERWVIDRWTGRTWFLQRGTYGSKREADRVGELENPGNHRR